MPKPVLSIKATHIGPIMKLDGTLSCEKQNLIFARNGTGKSFLARALRLLDKTVSDGLVQDEVAKNLVSEESPNGIGLFELFEDQESIGRIELNAGTFAVSGDKYIFHVFSEDYVTVELREKGFKLNGEITHQIIMGGDNIQLDQKGTDKETKSASLTDSRQKIDLEFESKKIQLQTDFQINARLGDYKSLKADVYFGEQEYSETQPEKSVAELLTSYNKFKLLPTDPPLPQGFEPDYLGLDIADIAAILKKVTSPSSVAGEVKQKITADPNFFKSGLKLKLSSDPDCPFCTQALTETALSAISVYQEYFADAEAKEKDALELLRQNVRAALKTVKQWRTDCLTSKSRFDDLRDYFPSMKDKQAEDHSSRLDKIQATLESIFNQLTSKIENLTNPLDMPSDDLSGLISEFETACAGDQKLFAAFQKLVSNAGTERKTLQVQACKAFRWEFHKNEKSGISNIRKLEAEIKQLEQEIAELRKTQGDKAPAKMRVAETFEILLNRFFGDKYTFDSTTFKLFRDGRQMSRGNDRTLSDGEKTVMAFCYFLAQSHLKVENNDDYSRLYYVFDDPVTSMSFDYVYEIVQTLKLLRIGAGGGVEFDLSSKPRPRMLILTHNNYFYNVASSNRAIKPEGLYQLVSGKDEHNLSDQQGFATPHQQQLKHVFDVSEGRTLPDFMTPNCIRSVVESMWKFCRPDIDDLGKFFEFLIAKYKIELKSVLINDLSHGGKFDDPPHREDDIIEASKEAIEVVRRFAAGQLKHL